MICLVETDKYRYSNGVSFQVKTKAAAVPVLKTVKVKKNRNVTVTFSNPSKNRGYDCILAARLDNDGYPQEAAYTIKNQNKKTVTFTNVKPGTYYVMAHGYVREKKTTGRKVFSDWSSYKKIVIK